MGEFIGLAAVICIFGGPVIAIILHHQRKMMEMRLQIRDQADQSVLTELRDLRNQMAELRDTTTKYDLSFDAALQRIESRVGRLEQRVTTLEHRASSVRAGVVE